MPSINVPSGTMLKPVKDYKDWIADRAEELAQEYYGISFYVLSGVARTEIWEEAKWDYIGRESARIDALYDAMQEKKLFCGDYCGGQPLDKTANGVVQ